MLTFGICIECAKSAQCAPLKHHYDECVERVTEQHDNPDHKGPKESCVEECELTHPSPFSIHADTVLWSGLLPAGCACPRRITNDDREADWLCVPSLPSIALRDAVCCPEAVPSTQIIDAAARPEIGWMEEEEGRANHGCKRVRCRLYRKPSGTHCHDVDGECTLVSIA